MPAPEIELLDFQLDQKIGGSYRELALPGSLPDVMSRECVQREKKGSKMQPWGSPDSTVSTRPQAKAELLLLILTRYFSIGVLERMEEMEGREGERRRDTWIWLPPT